MPVRNNDVAGIFNEIADLMEIQGENPFRVRAYRNAARAVGGLSRSIKDMVEDKEDLSRLPGVGKDLAAKIAEIVRSGKLQQLDELRGKIPSELSSLMRVAGLGAKRVKVLYDELGIQSAEDLKSAAESRKIRQLDGFGAKTEQKILESLSRHAGQAQRFGLAFAEQVVTDLLSFLEDTAGVKQVTAAGSYRRRKETVGDIDILVTCSKGSAVMDRFVGHEDVTEVISHGTTRSSVRLRSGIQVDVRVIPQKSYGAALHYFTGSQAHNIAVRTLGVKNNLKINEYGIFKGEKRIAGAQETDVFESIGLPYIEPELREDGGEIQAAQKNELPRLITIEDMCGDLHTHSKHTDGHFTIKEMAEAAREMGYAYIAVTDHSKHVTVTGGLDEKRLMEQIEEIDSIGARLKGITVLKGIEVDILADGSLDLSDDVLKELDLVIGSVHSSFSLSAEKQTGRILRAMDNPYFTILGHPSGRLINERDPYSADMEQIIRAAADRGCYLELNAHPERLDLTDTYCKAAKEAGVKVAISTDAHSLTDLELMRFGIGQARRGWLEAADVINTRSLKELRKLLRSRR